MRRLIALLLTCVLAACASTRAPAPAVRLPTLQLPPAALPQPLQLQQKLHFSFGRHQRELDALLEADAGSVRLAVQAMGQTGVRLQWDGRELTQQRAPWLPPQVRGERVLDDLQFALWPAAAIRAALPADWELREDGGVRRLQRDGIAWLVLEAGEDGVLRLRNLAEGYELEIESVAMDGNGP
ncbi:DUF3261 domain-containing protein [Flavobacterium sp. MXW15]|uniref:DUF3261 domain-containing protein n=1 Tax=Xanthomonas chitinilytica TaxID=2989819 RepID=A0ABT3JXU0_9XANT|nr:DUF3261 domain-containing protein [Xanthomonas sp. H13-6]MCW4455922.1 DUF3261 domain-containing protein [Flavobacterium sp. MXW15]MCW4473297.1 DUF3261 domain-containing protein [Xanthomonas sp. H13-6]